MGLTDGRQVSICPGALRRAEERAEAAESALAESLAKLAELRAAAEAYREEVRAWEHHADKWLQYESCVEWLERALAATEEVGETP